MNLVVSFVILICLASSEFLAGSYADHIWLRLAGIAVVAAAVPGLALVQTARIARSVGNAGFDGATFERLCNRITTCHTAVWLTASIAIMYAFRWHDVVRQNWQLDRFVLVDELLILAPVIFSLVASWFIFSELPQAWKQRDKTVTTECNLFQRWFKNDQRWSFILLRVRLHLFVLAGPLFLAICVSDLSPTLLQFPPWILGVGGILGFSAVFACLPMLVNWSWHSQQPTEATLLAFEDTLSLETNPPRLRIWNTQRQIINASASGLLPWFRQVWISDRLQELFPRPELQAIIRHEMAHLQQRHVAIRMLLLLMPLGIWSGLGWVCHRDLTLVSQVAASCEISKAATAMCLSFLYATYALATLRLISHRFEYDADLIACCKPSKTGTLGKTNYQLAPNRFQAMKNALNRLAIYMPRQVDRESLFHPSINNRIQKLKRREQASSDIEAGASLQQTSLMALGLAVTIVIVLTTAILILPE
jgi:Zn-dependent protease with chaperone function